MNIQSVLAESSVHPVHDVTRLRLTVLRLARRIRQNPTSDFSTSQQSILAVLDRYGPMTPGALAEIEGIQPPSVTRIMGNLEKAGYLTRAPVKGDLRQVEVCLTDAGKRAAARVHSSRDEWLAGMVENLPLEQQNGLSEVIRILELLLDNSSKL